MEKILIPVAAVCFYNWWIHPVALQPGKKSFTFYHLKGCHHCTRMKPVLRQLGCKYKDIDIRWVEERQNKELDVRSFPTLIYRDGNGEIVRYEGDRTANAIKQFLDSTS